MPEITIDAPAHPLRAYLRTPASAGPWPGIVVVHDVFGQTSDNRGQVDRLADAGYLTVAPDLYSWGNTLACVRATFRALFARAGVAFDDIEATRAMLAALPNCTGKVGVVGFCMGGAFALVAAVDRGFDASSVNYGQVPKDVDALLTGACPVVGSYGARDPSLRGAAERLDGALRANDVPHDVREYAEAGHGFLNDHGGALGWTLKKIGMGFEEASAADARARIVAFFDRHLR